jgi:hypothetical protein
MLSGRRSEGGGGATPVGTRKGWEAHIDLRQAGVGSVAIQNRGGRLLTCGVAWHSAGRWGQTRFESDSNVSKYVQMISKIVQTLTDPKRTCPSSNILK